MVDAGGAPVRILTVSGSLRAASSNSAILRAASLVAPAPMLVTGYDGIGALPFFNPDLDRALGDPLLPLAVRALRAAVGAADGLVISTPEYAHGVPGVLKNALDWLVGGPEMVERHVLLLSTSRHSVHAPASLAETLRTMSAIVLEVPPIELPRGGAMLDVNLLAGEPAVGPPLAAALVALADAIAAARARTAAPR
jgi:NAD(P)H-dependent FMN reductase